MKTPKKKKAPKKQKFSFILALGLTLMAGYFVISLINVQMDIKERKEEVSALKIEYEEQVAENEQLQAVVDGGDEAEYIERIAREKLGYVMPDEKVYYNVTPNN